MKGQGGGWRRKIIAIMPIRRWLLAPSRGKMSAGQKGVVSKWRKQLMRQISCFLWSNRKMKRVYLIYLKIINAIFNVLFVKINVISRSETYNIPLMSHYYRINFLYRIFWSSSIIFVPKKTRGARKRIYRFNFLLICFPRNSALGRE